MSDGGRPDGDGPSRKVGDHTRQRIDRLAEGWDSPKPVKVADGSGAQHPRAKRVSGPPPVPSDAPSGRAKRASPPPPPPARALERAETELLVESESRASTTDVTVPIGDIDATVLQDLEIERPAAPTPGARPRVLESVPRRRGLGGDVRYVFAAWFGVARARRELQDVDGRLSKERTNRAERLVIVARSVVADQDFTLAKVERARELLADVEEQRSRHAGASAAAEQEIEGLQKARVASHGAFRTDEQRLRTELQAIESKLAPLEKQAAKIRRQAAELARTKEALDGKIKKDERSLVAVRRKDDPQAIEARLAAARADREALQRDEPALAAELDAVEPRIASLSAARDETRRGLDDVQREDAEDQERTDEKVAAARARKQVEDRAVGDCDKRRNDILRALGEYFDVERPDPVVARLRGVDEHSVAIATLERRALELREVIDGIDRGAMVRGVAVLAAAAGALGAVLWWTLLR